MIIILALNDSRWRCFDSMHTASAIFRYLTTFKFQGKKFRRLDTLKLFHNSRCTFQHLCKSCPVEFDQISRIFHESIFTILFYNTATDKRKLYILAREKQYIREIATQSMTKFYQKIRPMSAQGFAFLGRAQQQRLYDIWYATQYSD